MPDKITNGRADPGMPPMMLPFGLEALMEFNRPALAVMAQMNGKVYENLANMNKNWVSFVNRRLKEEFSMPKQLATCKTVQEMYGVYADFFQAAVADYQSEFEQMGKLGKTLADETMQALQVRAEESAREARTS
jgi:hypothetical protein